jgi:hypothetical protein
VLLTIGEYAKGMRGDYFYPRGLVADQILEGMSAPDEPVRQDDGTWLITGCRPHSCFEKTAVIATSGGEALAAGILHFHCRPDKKKSRGADCDDRYTLTIWLRPHVTSPFLPQNLREWATKAVARYNDYGPIGTYEVRMLPR